MIAERENGAKLTAVRRAVNVSPGTQTQHTSLGVFVSWCADFEFRVTYRVSGQPEKTRTMSSF